MIFYNTASVVFSLSSSTTECTLCYKMILPYNVVIYNDFTKTFDTVSRKILYSKLRSIGISTKFLEMIKNIYSEIKCRVKTSSGCTDDFRIDNGLMQGESLSTTLFGAFINDLVEKLNNCRSMRVTMNKVEIYTHHHAC